MKLLSRLRSNPLVETFCELKGNQKVVLITQPLWAIPNVLYVPFATLYMYVLGLNDIAIGTIITAGMISQIFFAFLGGVLTDKIGRRKNQAIFDFIAWTTPCLIWAFAQNFWWFLAAQILNGAIQATNCSFTCLFTEDCPPKQLVNGFSLMQITGALAVFFSPIAIVMVSTLSLETAVRIIYFSAAVLITLKLILLYFFGSETSVGKIRIEETKNTPYFIMFKNYLGVFKNIVRSRRMRFMLAIMLITNVYTIATGSFFSLYVTNELNISQNYIAVFPMIRGLVMLLFLIGLQKLIHRFSIKTSIGFGLLCYVLSHIALIIAPPQSIAMVVLYTLLEVVGFSMVIPRRDALLTLSIEKNERSRIFALVNVMLLFVTAPFASLIGYLSFVDRRLPFIFNIILFIIMAVIVIRSKIVGEIEPKKE